MRIVYVCGYNNSVSGGVQNVVPEYVRNLSKCANITILDFGKAGFDVPRSVSVVNRSSELFPQLKEIDLVVFHEVYYLRYYRLAQTLYRRCIPYIIIPHGSLTQGAQSQKKLAKKLFNLLWVNRFVGHAKSVQYLSNGEMQASVYSRCPHIIVPNGINLTENHKTYDGQKKGMRLVYIGRLSIYHKGLDYLIRACRLIREEMIQNNIFLDIYGTDFDGGRDQLEGFVTEFELDECVAVHDGIFNDKKTQVLLGSDIFIQTSRFEGQPMGILETLQLGIPVIVTPGTTFGDIVQKRKCGWSVEEDEQSIANGILSAYSDRLNWSTFGKNARTFARVEYSWDAVTEKTIREYGRLSVS